MKFKKLLQSVLPKGWSNRSIDYKGLKQIVKSTDTSDDILTKLTGAVFTRMLKKNIAVVNKSYMAMRNKLAEVLKKFSTEVERKLKRLQTAKESEKLLVKETYQQLLRDIDNLRIYCVANYLVCAEHRCASSRECVRLFFDSVLRCNARKIVGCVEDSQKGCEK